MTFAFKLFEERGIAFLGLKSWGFEFDTIPTSPYEWVIFTFATLDQRPFNAVFSRLNRRPFYSNLG